MAGGSWWREDGAGSGGGGPVPDGGESVYLPPQAADSPPAAAPDAPPVPPRPSAPPAPPVPMAKPRPAEPPRPDGPTPAEVHRAFDFAEDHGRTDVTAVYPGWSEVFFDLPVEESAPKAEPEPEPVPAPDPAPAPEAAPAPDRPGLGRRALKALLGRPQPAPAPEAKASAPGAGRRPAPLLLLGAVLLIGGAATGMLLVMLLGWGLAYLSHGWSDLMKKFAVLGIPLITVTGLTVWNWGREQGRWGAALAPGTHAGAATWAAAPGVLRVAAALSALFVLAVALRRRKGE
ncbi:hypothetical protein ACIQBJ_25915 [Kitasatospora sp. NPDC088391]|uniref:hypothetical protein n=1 Tax=Kitasatospora sp. NPDC088391 TaxID=3364074 RepID=UPI00382984B4